MWSMTVAMILGSNIITRKPDFLPKPKSFWLFSWHSFHMSCRQSIDAVAQTSLSKLPHKVLAVCCLGCCDCWHFGLKMIGKAALRIASVKLDMIMSGMSYILKIHNNYRLFKEYVILLTIIMKSHLPSKFHHGRRLQLASQLYWNSV